jgi:hypothetical protein
MSVFSQRMPSRHGISPLLLSTDRTDFALSIAEKEASHLLERKVRSGRNSFRDAMKEIAMMKEKRALKIEERIKVLLESLSKSEAHIEMTDPTPNFDFQSAFFTWHMFPFTSTLIAIGESDRKVFNF